MRPFWKQEWHSSLVGISCHHDVVKPRCIGGKEGNAWTLHASVKSLQSRSSLREIRREQNWPWSSVAKDGDADLISRDGLTAHRLSGLKRRCCKVEGRQSGWHGN
jgi:hypothetical protein